MFNSNDRLQVVAGLHAFVAAALLVTAPAPAATIRVGPNGEYTRPSEVARLVKAGDIVEIEAGEYRGDVAVWRADNLTIRGIGGRAHLAAGGADAEGKGIWVVKGDNVTVENIEFSGASVADKNGAGIRQEGRHLTVRNCYFHHNENGILAGTSAQSEILIENSEFGYNGYGEGYTHNVYIGEVGKLTVRHSYIHHADAGHQIKSRARETVIAYNRLMDEEDGNSSYIIDLSNGGRALIIGNLIQQGPRAENWTMISFAAEGGAYEQQELYVVNNTFVNDRGSGRFITIAQSAEQALLINNIFSGRGDVIQGRAEQISNLITRSPGLVDSTTYDYRLKPDSQAIDAGTATDGIASLDLTPGSQYVHPARGRPRPVDGHIDIGAYEYEP